MSAKVFDALDNIIDSATKSEKKLIKNIKQHLPEELIYFSITELAEIADVAEATILRLCRKLGYKGFQDFKLMLSKDIGAVTEAPSKAKDKVAYDMKKVIEQSSQNIDEESVTKIAKMIVSSRKVCFFGAGNSNIATTAAKHRLLKLGLNVDCTMDIHLQSIMTANLQSDDLLVLVSVSGSTKDMLELKKIADESGVKTAVITCYARSPLAKSCDNVICNNIKVAASAGGLLSTVVSQLYMIDVLCSTVHEMIGEDADINESKASRSVSDKLL